MESLPFYVLEITPQVPHDFLYAYGIQIFIDF